VESLDRAFENVCELDLVFHFDEVCLVSLRLLFGGQLYHAKVHHILAEVIQGGLVLETNVDEIDMCGRSKACRIRSLSADCHFPDSPTSNKGPERVVCILQPACSGRRWPEPKSREPQDAAWMAHRAVGWCRHGDG
jgi:Clathrin adaptor complex small chain